MKFKDGEAWKKIFGPFFVYVNSVAGKGDRQMLWRDANRQVSYIHILLTFILQTIKAPFEIVVCQII